MRTIRPFNAQDIKDIRDLLTSNRWEYFLHPVIANEELSKRTENYFSGDGIESFVCRDEHGKLLGLIRFFDIEDSDISSPEFTVYVDEQARQIGVGTDLLRMGLQFVFNTYLNTRRVEATTRCDNIPMQRLFESTGFTKESQYRKDWKNTDTGEYMDAFGYAILKDEFMPA